jgi:hypothetical protein
VPSNSSKQIPYTEPALVFLLGAALFCGWLLQDPSNQDLLANYAKAQDLASLIAENKGFSWWSANYRC